MRETPSSKFTQIKKSFFARGQSRVPLGGSVEAFKGVFSSMRVATNPANKPCLTVTVDVANGTFFQEARLQDAVLQMLNISNPQAFFGAFQQAVEKGWDKSMMKTNLKRLTKVKVIVAHRRDPETNQPAMYMIDKIISRTAHEHKIEIRDGDKREWMTVAEYFRRRYNMTVVNGLPLVKMTKKESYIPMDVCKIVQNQRYPFKLNEKQTVSNSLAFILLFQN